MMCEKNEGRSLFFTKKRLSDFFMGVWYPVFIAVLVFLGHAFAIEFYLNFLVMASVITALLVCDSIRPVIVVLCTYTYQISIDKTPAIPTFSDYYYTGGRLFWVLSLFVLCAAAFVYFFIRNKLVTKSSLFALPMLIPAAVLSLAFLLNGAFASEWSLASLGYGALQIIPFFLILYVILLGLKNEKSQELLDYFIYVSAVIAVLLMAQVLHRYITADSLVTGGSVDKEQMVLGWGIWTIVGIEQAVLIPTLFLGVMRKGGYKSYLYLAVACLCYVSVIMSMARNSMVFGTLALLTCAILCMFFGKVKKAARIAVPAGACLVLLAVLVFREPIFKILSDYITYGFSDNGRYDLWKYGTSVFLENPIFGKGFFGIETDTFKAFGFFPQMLHNTPIQLLASMGIVGLLAYAYYRAVSLKPFFKKPSIEKAMLGLSMLVLILSGLLDNMMFYIQTMFYYAVTEAVVYKLLYEEDKSLGLAPIKVGADSADIEVKVNS